MSVNEDDQDNEDDPLAISIPQAARLLGIGRNQAYEAVRKHQLPSIQIGRRKLVPLSRLKRLLDGGQAKTANGQASRPHLSTADP